MGSQVANMLMAQAAPTDQQQMTPEQLAQLLALANQVKTENEQALNPNAPSLAEQEAIVAPAVQGAIARNELPNRGFPGVTAPTQATGGGGILDMISKWFMKGTSATDLAPQATPAPVVDPLVLAQQEEERKRKLQEALGQPPQQ